MFQNDISETTRNANNLPSTLPRLCPCHSKHGPWWTSSKSTLRTLPWSAWSLASAGQSSPLENIHMYISNTY